MVASRVKKTKPPLRRTRTVTFRGVCVVMCVVVCVIVCACEVRVRVRQVRVRVRVDACTPARYECS